MRHVRIMEQNIRQIAHGSHEGLLFLCWKIPWLFLDETVSHQWRVWSRFWATKLFSVYSHKPGISRNPKEKKMHYLDSRHYILRSLQTSQLCWAQNKIPKFEKLSFHIYALFSRKKSILKNRNEHTW